MNGFLATNDNDGDGTIYLPAETMADMIEDDTLEYAFCPDETFEYAE